MAKIQKYRSYQFQNKLMSKSGECSWTKQHILIFTGNALAENLAIMIFCIFDKFPLGNMFQRAIPHYKPVPLENIFKTVWLTKCGAVWLTMTPKSCKKFFAIRILRVFPNTTHQIKLEHFAWLRLSYKEDFLFCLFIGESDKCLVRCDQIFRGGTFQWKPHHYLLMVISFNRSGNGCWILDAAIQ